MVSSSPKIQTIPKSCHKFVWILHKVWPPLQRRNFGSFSQSDQQKGQKLKLCYGNQFSTNTFPHPLAWILKVWKQSPKGIRSYVHLFTYANIDASSMGFRWNWCVLHIKNVLPHLKGTRNLYCIFVLPKKDQLQKLYADLMNFSEGMLTFTNKLPGVILLKSATKWAKIKIVLR